MTRGGGLPAEVWAEREVAPTLNSMDNTGESRATVLAFATNQREEVRDLGELSVALNAEPGTHAQTFLALPTVRRLTPVETERLQGFPDGWTAKRVNDKGDVVDQADSARYKQMGNAVAVPCVEWIMRNLVAYSLKTTSEADNGVRTEY